MFNLIRRDKAINSAAPSLQTCESQQWQVSSDIFYLLDTVKISYDSPLGKITVEDICLENCTECLTCLKEMTQVDRGSCPFVMTVCGVTWDIWETNEGIQHRIRAIPKAAGLRFFDDNRAESDAYFYHASHLTLDSAPSDYFTDRETGEAKTRSALTPEQFICSLKMNNQQFIDTHGKPLYLSKANFDAPMTAHESASFSEFATQPLAGTPRCIIS